MLLSRWKKKKKKRNEDVLCCCCYFWLGAYRVKEENTSIDRDEELSSLEYRRLLGSVGAACRHRCAVGDSASRVGEGVRVITGSLPLISTVRQGWWGRRGSFGRPQGFNIAFRLTVPTFTLGTSVTLFSTHLFLSLSHTHTHTLI